MILKPRSPRLRYGQVWRGTTSWFISDHFLIVSLYGEIDDGTFWSLFNKDTNPICERLHDLIWMLTFKPVFSLSSFTFLPQPLNSITLVIRFQHTDLGVGAQTFNS